MSMTPLSEMYLRSIALSLRLLLWVAVMSLGLTWCSAPAFADGIPRAAEIHKRTLIRTAHAGWGLDAPIATFAAQVHQESRWRPDVTSPAGAQGLAQFMPATAQWMSDIYPATLGPAEPYNPGWAMRAMVAYDQWLYQRVRAINECHRWAMTLAAYNGGLGWVFRDRDMALASGASQLVWFDEIEPFNAGRSGANFRENRHYVRIILLRWEPLYSHWGAGVCTHCTVGL